ncbi:MAG TPA: glycosyltransferase family 2 protein [Dehalococcoidia bacterium]|nr:glycosyltransferase family 2 protein [Dehalococcoidia bacterium]
MLLTTSASTANAYPEQGLPSNWGLHEAFDPFPMATPTVAIVLVNYNGAAFIDEFASSLARVAYPEQRLFIIDNASTDGSREKLPRLFPQACIVNNETNVGLAPALNQALQRCLDGRTNYVLLLNTDTTHAPDFLDKLVAAANDRTIVVPKVLSYYDHGRINTHAGGFDWTRGTFRGTYDGRPDGPWTAARREIETASFCCMLIPATVFHDVGGMDERLAMYYEDTDFAARARAMGYRLLFEPSAVVYHREGGSGGGKESPFKHYYATRNRPYLVKKHSGRLRYAAFTAYFLTTRIARMALYALRGNLPLLRAQWLALRDYYGGRMGMTYTPAELSKVVGA